MQRFSFGRVLGTVLALFLTATVSAQSARPAAVKSPRVYVLDGGVLASETARYRLTDADVQEVPISVASFPAPIQRALKLTPEGIEMFEPQHFRTRSQDLIPAYHDAAQFCWGTADAWIAQRTVFSHDAVGVVLPRHEVQDIDTEEDWEFAEALYRLNQTRAK